MFTVRSRKAYKSLVKHTAKYGYILPFTELEFSTFLVDSLRSGECPYCRGELTWDNFSPDHITPLMKDGSPGLDNICIVCAPCNFMKGPYTDGRQLSPYHSHYSPKHIDCGEGAARKGSDGSA